jgi:hypothetical protein
MKRGFACAPRLVIVSLIESVTSSTPWLTVSITCSPRWLTVSVTASVTPSTPLPTASTATLTDSNTASFTSPTALAICGGERTKRLKGGSNVRPIGHSVKPDAEKVCSRKANARPTDYSSKPRSWGLQVAVTKQRISRMFETHSTPSDHLCRNQASLRTQSFRNCSLPTAPIWRLVLIPFKASMKLRG